MTLVVYRSIFLMKVLFFQAKNIPNLSEIEFLTMISGYSKLDHNVLTKMIDRGFNCDGDLSVFAFTIVW